MSRLRRLVVSDRWFFVTCRLLPRRRILTPSEFSTLAVVIGERRAEHGFLLAAWVFLPDHWHVTVLLPTDEEKPQRNANCAYLCATRCGYVFANRAAFREQLAPGPAARVSGTPDRGDEESEG